MSHEISRTIRTLCESTEQRYSAVSQVRKAFILGLWYRSFPAYMVENLTTLYSWDLSEIDPEAARGFDSLENSFKFQFISDTGDSWHQCYRDLRSRGWRRLKVHRNGGRLQYLLKIESAFTWEHEGDAAGAQKSFQMPEGYRELHLLLDISISTCKQVQVGTEIKEVPVMKTVCEDLVELPEESLISSGSVEAASTVVSQLVVIPDVDKVLQDSEPEPRCDHGHLSGCCNQHVDCPHFMGHDDPEPATDHYDNYDEQGIGNRTFKDEIPF